MLQMESFDSRDDVDGLEVFLREKALSYWRKRGFQVKACVTRYGLLGLMRDPRARVVSEVD